MAVRLPNSMAVQVGGRQERLRCRLRVPGHYGHRSQHSMNPSEQTQSPIARIEPDDARADVIEGHGPGKERPSKRSIMDIGGREQKEQWQA